MLEPPSELRSVEDWRVAREDAEARLKAIEAIFSDDDDAQLVLMGDLDGLEAHEVRAAGGWNEQEYATVRRRIRRKISAAFPKGWVQ